MLSTPIIISFLTNETIVYKLIKKILEYFIDIGRLIEFFIKKVMGKYGHNIVIKPSTSVFKGVSHFHFEGDLNIARYVIKYLSNTKVIIGKSRYPSSVKIIFGKHKIDKVGNVLE